MINIFWLKGTKFGSKKSNFKTRFQIPNLPWNFKNISIFLAIISIYKSIEFEQYIENESPIDICWFTSISSIHRMTEKKIWVYIKILNYKCWNNQNLENSKSWKIKILKIKIWKIKIWKIKILKNNLEKASDQRKKIAAFFLWSGACSGLFGLFDHFLDVLAGPFEIYWLFGPVFII
jgi:hypothetical protein